MPKPSQVIEYMGYLLVLLVLVGFLLVGYFLPNAEALVLDQYLRLLALLGMGLFGVGRWVLRSPSAR